MSPVLVDVGDGETRRALLPARTESLRDSPVGLKDPTGARFGPSGRVRVGR